MYRTEEDVLFEARQAKLADFLRGRPCSENPTDEDMRAWCDARTMLMAPQLLEACEYALALIRSLSSEDFAAGGDKPARDRLADAIEKVKEGFEIPHSLVATCAEDVRNAIRLNREQTL